MAKLSYNGKDTELKHGDLVIAAITSCTNTSNPMVMLGAGLVAKKAAEKGLFVAPHIKTSLAPGSGVVTHYLKTRCGNRIWPCLDSPFFVSGAVNECQTVASMLEIVSTCCHRCTWKQGTTLNMPLVVLHSASGMPGTALSHTGMASLCIQNDLNNGSAAQHHQVG